MKKLCVPAVCLLLLISGFSAAQQDIVMFPANNAVDVNPDTHLELTFPTAPVAGTSGQIRIYDAADDQLVDMLNLGIPPGPTTTTPSPDAVYTTEPYDYAGAHLTNANTKPGTPSGKALPASGRYQLTIIGGFSDGFHFYPVIIHDNKATIYPHNNLLQYDKTYYVQIDQGVLAAGNKAYAVADKTSWRFTTKRQPPGASEKTLVVNADGTGDFNTVQGAIDFVPDHDPQPVTIFIRNGLYEEIVYFRNKSNLTLLGENRNKVMVYYNNNEIFNPHPPNLKTNEVSGSFPSRRAAFAVDNSSNIKLVNFTIRTTGSGQAEGLLLNGEKIIVSNITVVGSGDALQTNGSAYFSDCNIVGDGDTILGRGPAFFNNCELSSQGPFMWVRNTDENHGNVFVNCLFITRGDKPAVLARAPTNGDKSYPYAEAVLLDSTLIGIAPAGWGEIGGDTSNVHFWEYNSRVGIDRKPLDARLRHPASRQLDKDRDAETIANYRNPAYVLGSWAPAMAPIMLAQTQSATVDAGKPIALRVIVAAVPEPAYQWYKDGKPVEGETSPALRINSMSANDVGEYRVKVTNKSGSISSLGAFLKLK